mgnify:CR=1 FL=1
MGKTAQAGVYRAYINQMKKKTKKNEMAVPSPSRKMVKKMKKKGNTSVPYGRGYKKVNEQKEVKKIEKISCYKDFYNAIGVHYPDEIELAKELRWAIVRSQRKRYHSNYKQKKFIMSDELIVTNKDAANKMMGN